MEFARKEALVSSLQQSLRSKLISYTTDLLDNNSEIQELLSVWTDLWDPEEQLKRIQILCDHCLSQVTESIEDILKKEVQSKELYIERVEKLLEEIAELQTHLHVTIPYDDVEKLPLHEMALCLNKKAEKYRIIRDERMTRLVELRERETQVCGDLGAARLSVEVSPIPTENELAELETGVVQLENERKQRKMNFMSARTRIMELFNLLGTKPALNFEKDVVLDERAKEFKLTEENMELVNGLLMNLEKRLTAAETQCVELKQKLKGMWSYLELPEHEQEEFLIMYSGCTEQTIQLIKLELERCNKLKADNIGKFIERIRLELVKIWDEAFVSKEYRQSFQPFRVTLYNEDLYTLHELELEKWKNYLVENGTIFNLYKRHVELFDKLKDLDGQGRSVKRFHNRGGQLLREEKTRKMVTKELPKVEDDLRQALSAYEARHDRPFLYFGRPLAQIIDEQWETNFDPKLIDKFRNHGGKTPAKRAATPVAPMGATPAKQAKTRPQTPMITREKTQPAMHLQVHDSTILLEPSYEEFQKNLTQKLDSAKMNKKVSRSTEVLTPAARVLRARNNAAQKVLLRTPLSAAKSTPVLNSPAWASVRMNAAAKTAPAAAMRHQSKVQQIKKTPRKKLPLIL